MTRDEIIGGFEREIRRIRREPKEKMLGVCITVDEAEEIVELLKEQPKWHVFHKCELTEEEKNEHPTWEWIMRCDCVPNHGEEILLYTKDCREIFLDHWDDDMWAEYACTMDGTPLDDGDAWMELPKPPEEEQG